MKIMLNLEIRAIFFRKKPGTVLIETIFSGDTMAIQVESTYPKEIIEFSELD